MISEIYDAFISAGAPEDKARKAGEAMTTKDDDRIGKIDSRLGKIEDRLGKVEDRIAKVEGELLVLKWMMGFVLAFQVAIFAKLFFH